MSRAFTKDRDDAPEPPLPAPERTHPNYVTPRGLRLLRERRKAATEPREVEHFDRELDSAIVVHPPEEREEVAFGASVHVLGEKFDGTFSIVGDDEADIASGKISFTSPLAAALMGARNGDRVIWHRPIGDMELRVTGITYDE